MQNSPLEISPEDLHRRLQAGDDIQLIDVREEMEFEYCHLPGSLLLPLDELPRRAAEIRTEGPVVVICHHGVRSAHALGYLRQRLGRTNVSNLRGGVDAWALQVDPAFPTY
ncbi:rhodanese-like domain-containing protein [Hymenobacter siberiensis]|jgi:rhodanese-related sulfurtransferase|uniref:rhodanese-like domain-containing protein n=1 Tax=Hymenobacter siberiensis TaxID=2848396 RepID=UPI001C1DE84E|nr:rhodanese-like domain-containing protein [Hymenobacter siberiensis]MBU6120146.1 rhodanese [Hymenobacter siberiensis]